MVVVGQEVGEGFFFEEMGALVVVVVVVVVVIGGDRGGSGERALLRVKVRRPTAGGVGRMVWRWCGGGGCGFETRLAEFGGGLGGGFAAEGELVGLRD